MTNIGRLLSGILMRLKNEILTKALSAVRILFSGSTKTYVANDAHATETIKNDY